MAEISASKTHQRRRGISYTINGSSESGGMAAESMAMRYQRK